MCPWAVCDVLETVTHSVNHVSETSSLLKDWLSRHVVAYPSIEREFPVTYASERGLSDLLSGHCHYHRTHICGIPYQIIRFGTRPLFGDHGNDRVVATALIWAALIAAVTTIVQGSRIAPNLLPILIGGAGGSVLLVTIAVRRVKRRPDC